MSGEHSYILHLLHTLEASLSANLRPAEAVALGKIIGRISAARSIDTELELLARVEGWNRFALRVMWYIHRAQTVPDETANASLTEFRVNELLSLIDPIPQDEPEADVPPQPAPGVPEALSDALKNFGYIIEELKARSFASDEFVRLDAALLEMTLSESERLRRSGEEAGHDVLVRFADAFGVFVRFTLERELFYDVRVINLIDNATVTLQSVLDPAASEQNDALLQTIDLLENPIAVLE